MYKKWRANTNLTANPVVVLGVIVLSLASASSPARLAIATTARNAWTPIGPEGEYVKALAIDSRRPTTLFAGTERRGIFRSSDGGGSWQAVNGDLNSPWVSALAIDPRTSTTIYAGLGSVSVDTGGVFKSTDGGGSWHAMNNGLSTPSRTPLSIYALAIDPRTPTTLYAGRWGGVWKSTDSGGSWRAMNTGLDATGLDPNLNPSDMNFNQRFVLALTIDPRTPTTIYAVTSFGLGNEVHGVFKSTDGA